MATSISCHCENRWKTQNDVILDMKSYENTLVRLKKKKKRLRQRRFGGTQQEAFLPPVFFLKNFPRKPFFPPHPTYQAVLSPSKESFRRRASALAYLSHHLPEFIAFMVPNTIGFFTSLAEILLVMDEFPLKSLMEISVRCLATSYVSMLKQQVMFPCFCWLTYWF